MEGIFVNRCDNCNRDFETSNEYDYYCDACCEMATWYYELRTLQTTAQRLGQAIATIIDNGGESVSVSGMAEGFEISWVVKLTR